MRCPMRIVHSGCTQKTAMNVGGGMFVLTIRGYQGGAGGAPVYVQCTITFAHNFSEDAKSYLIFNLGVTPATSWKASVMAAIAIASASFGIIKLSCTDRQP